MPGALYKSVMNIDGNEKEKNALELIKSGNRKEGMMLEDEYVADVHKDINEGEDHCTCPDATCRHHGKCLDCVVIHRGHRDHLPYCFHDMITERMNCMGGLVEKDFSK